VLAWLILHIGGLFTPGLLDDVDSVYLQIAREMLQRHDFVTPTIDGIRFFDKPPLMYWFAAGSMHLFGVHDWAGRLPLALLTLVLLLATYALGLRLFAGISPAAHPDRAALYSALALATCVGPYLYTRFFIPDIVVALWMILAVHAFLLALNRINAKQSSQDVGKSGVVSTEPRASEARRGGSGETPAFRLWAANSSLLPCLAFAAVTALNLLTKGFIGLVFPLAFVFLYLAFTRQLRLLPKFHLIPSTLVFLAIAAPWHILAALRNPPIALPPLACPRTPDGPGSTSTTSTSPASSPAASPTTTARSPSPSSGSSPPSGSSPG
jgi:4-amino-4-deoxy-L-arabinose transferase-like glycosyltransferase